jgi:hypothetical protein
MVAQRNAKVLKRKCVISRDTDFYKRLITFRSERDEKIRRSINNTQLVLPGRIIHLVDIKGDNSASGYVPYYARRREFNQLIVSKRMIADHDIHYLVDILENTRLCGDFNVISCAFGSSPCLVDEDVPDVDIRLFICCSNPYGKMPILISMLATAAFGLALWTHLGCRFYIASFPDLPVLAGAGETLRISYGLYMYSVVKCTRQDGICGSLGEYERLGKCLPYPMVYVEDQDMVRAQVFAFVVETTGFIALSIILVSQCFSITRSWWKFVSILFLMASLFQGLVMLPVRGCEDDMDRNPANDCQLAQNGVGCVVACCLWFVCAVCSMSIAKKSN